MLTPFYRLLDSFNLDTRISYRRFRKLNVRGNKNLMTSVNAFLSALRKNASGKARTAIHTWADAAGPRDRVWNPETYGCGGICEDLEFA